MKRGLTNKLVIVNVVLCILAIMMVMSCTGTSTSTLTSSTTTAALEPLYGGTLHILTSAPASLNLGNPHQSIPNFNPFMPMPAIENLFNRDDAGNAVPWLASSYDLDKTALTLTIHLNEGICFSDGTPFDAEAAKWNIDTNMASGQQGIRNFKSIDVINPYTIRVNMSQWDILMPMYFVLKGGNTVSPTNIQKNGMDYAVEHPVATGAFVLADYQKEVLIKYTKNPNYHIPGKPYLDAIQWDLIADPVTREMAFEAGDGQVILGLTPSQADKLAKTGKYNVTKAITQVFSLYPDSVNPESPWSNVLVRQAASYAIDRKAICDAKGYGFYEPTDQLGFPGNAMYDPTIPGYPFNVAEAQRLMDEAGYPDGFDTTLWCGSNDDPDIWAAIQQYLAAIGIRAVIERVESAKLMDLSTRGWFNGMNAFMSPFMSLGFPPLQTLFFYFTTGSLFGVSCIRPPEIDALEAQALSAETVAGMDQITQQINNLLTMKYCVCIPLYTQPSIAVKVKWLHDDRIQDTWQEQWFPQDAWFEAPYNTTIK